jgi:SAM-dependent methyltransferase
MTACTEIAVVPGYGRIVAGGSFDESYRRWRTSTLHAELFGSGIPSSVQPFSFVPMEGLRYAGVLLGLQAGQTLVDLGCGRGGPGLWLAAQSGARLIGVDSSAVAIADARQRRTLFPGASGAAFHVGDAIATALPAGSVDAVVTIDVLQLLDDPAALVVEGARLLRPGGRFLATTWEGHGDAPERFPRSVRALVERAGLQVDLLDERPAWLRRQLDIYQRAAGVTEPDPAVRDLAREGARWETIHQHVRRVVVRGHLPR